MDGRARPLLAAALLALLSSNFLQAADLDRLNASLAGHMLDLTHNHGSDGRFWSESLGLARDMYVYLPPGYDSAKAYPLFLWIHGFGGGEQQFTRQVVHALDESIVSGAMPPVIAVCPDCSVPDKWKLWYQGSWCINSPQGRWEDYVVDDVMRFVSSQFNIRPEREAHVIAGWSMGGFAAYNLSFKHPEQFRLVVGIYPNLNIRYADRAGHWGTDFDPANIGWLPVEGLRWAHYLGRYPKPWRFPIPCGVVYWPAWGHDQSALDRMSQENPYELVDRLDIRDGQFDLFIAYGRQDEYNVDAQVDSFLHKAKERHLNIWVRYNPDGHHATQYVNECMPDVLMAVGARMREVLPDLSKTESVVESASASSRVTASAYKTSALQPKSSETNSPPPDKFQPLPPRPK